MMFAHHATPPPPPIFSSAFFRGTTTTPRRSSSSSSSSTTTKRFGSTVRRVSATTRRGTFEREPHTHVVLIFENALNRRTNAGFWWCFFCFREGCWRRRRVGTSSRSLDLSILCDLSILYDLARVCLKKASSRLSISQIAIGRAVKGGAISPIHDC